MPSILTRVNFSMQRMQLFYSGGTILRPSSRHGLSRFPSPPPPPPQKKEAISPIMKNLLGSDKFSVFPYLEIPFQIALVQFYLFTYESPLK